jgi:hypothetical protein
MWIGVEKISRTDCVKNDAVLHTVNEEINILDTIKSRKANWIFNVLLSNCVLKHVIDRRREEEKDDASSYCVI